MEQTLAVTLTDAAIGKIKELLKEAEEISNIIAKIIINSNDNG